MAAAWLGNGVVIDWRLDVGDDTGSPRRARAHLRRLLRAGGWPDETIESACVAISELVTNALLYGGGVVGADLDLDERCLRASITDRTRTMPTRRTPDPRTPTGRGLMLVERLCDRWGVNFLFDGHGSKQVWYELDRPG